MSKKDMYIVLFLVSAPLMLLGAILWVNSHIALGLAIVALGVLALLLSTILVEKSKPGDSEG